MEQDRVNESSSKEQFKKNILALNVSQKNAKNLVENLIAQTEYLNETETVRSREIQNLIELQRQLYELEVTNENLIRELETSPDRSISNTVEKSLVAAAGIAGGAALLNPILGPTVATVGALLLAGAYIFLNFNNKLPKSEEESGPTDENNA